MAFKNKTGNFLRRNWSNILFGVLLLLLLFSPSAKAWVLQRFMDVGLFKAEIKEEVNSGYAAPFTFNDADGNIHSTESLKGKVVFINFWATWCPPCQAEMPALNSLYEQFRNDDRIVFLFLNEDNDVAKAKDYLQNNKFSMPLVRLSGPVSDALYSGTLPTTIVLNKSGQVVFRHEGVANYNSKQFINQLKALL